jgi:hypothetical protein
MRTWCTNGLLTESTSSAATASNLGMSPPKVAILSSGASAPAPAIICWHSGFSANWDRAPVAAA